VPGRRIRRLRRSELPIDTTELARYLIGKTLVRELDGARMTGRIVETEAYVIGDAAGHAFRGRTQRNEVLFWERGHAYVYFIYGVHYMLNVSSETPGIGAGVLLRALEPFEGIELMQRNRGTTALRELARGPGRLAYALRIDPSLNGVDLCAAGPLWLGAEMHPVGRIGKSTRIGLTLEAHRVLRFYERDNVFVSGSKRLNQ
jgi:DNA-3-methyladenine glycosylase